MVDAPLPEPASPVPVKRGPHHRPRDLSPAQLGFTRRTRVPWLAPGLLGATALRVLLAHLFGAYLDKRELQGVLPAKVYQHADTDELWVDYVADLGDGFDATYSVAWLLAQPELRVSDLTRPLPRGQVLVMGGDQVYPTASWRQYEDRCKGPYQAALPRADPEPSLYCLPGNHDWYDGLTAYLRLFGKGESIGGWRTRQSRSYAALRLPHRWWLFAIDVQLDAYLDEPQLDYFRHCAETQLRPGDRVIICTARPSWVYAADAPHEYDTLDYFIRKVIEPTGASVALLLAGDAHHYARYERLSEASEELDGAPSTSAQHLVTCGGGGAYLSPTHHLPPQLQVPPAKPAVRASSRSRPYQLRSCYPDHATSRRLTWGIFWRLLGRNPGFSGLLATLHTLLFLSVVTLAGRVLSLPLALMGTVVMGFALGFALSGAQESHRFRPWLLGTCHGLAHLALGITAGLLWSRLGADGPLWLSLAAFGYAPVAGLLATYLVAGYLWIADRCGVNSNELFAAQGIEHAKSFLRLHIAGDGTLTVYPMAVDRVCRSWRAAPDDPPEAPWIAPQEPLRARLIEPPFTVTG